MPWDFGAGVAGAAGAGAELIGDSIKRDRNLEDATKLEALKEQFAQNKRDKIAAIINNISRTTQVDSFDPMGNPTTVTKPKDEIAYRRERSDALAGKGYIDEAEKDLNHADTHEERMYQRKTQADKQVSDEARWKASQEQAERFHKDTVRYQMAQLNLKGESAKDFGAAADSYIDAKSAYDVMTAKDSNATPEQIASFKQDVDRASLKLKQYKVDVGDTASPFIKHMQLSSTLNSLDTMLKDPMLDDTDKAKAKAARSATLDQMTVSMKSTGGTDGDSTALPPLADRVVGQVYLSQNGPMEWTDKGWKKSSVKPAAATAAAPATATPGIINEPTSKVDNMTDPVIRETKGGRGGTQYYVTERGARSNMSGMWISEAKKTELGL